MSDIEVHEIEQPLLELLATIEAETDGEALLDHLLHVRAIKDVVNSIARDAERAAAEKLEGVKTETYGRHQVEVRWSKARRWTDADGLRSMVSRIARFDPESGEERTATEAVQILTSAFRCGGAEARMTWLKEHDIDPDEFSEGDWKSSITITPARYQGEGAADE